MWTVLVLVALGVLFLAGRRVWRSGRALLTELGRAGEVLERLEEGGALLSEPRPASFDLVAARELSEAARARRAARSERRAARHAAAQQRWQAFVR